MELKFVVDGEAVGKQRPRVVKRGRYVRTYTPEKTVTYEAHVRECYWNQIGDMMLRGAIKARIACYFAPPKSITKKTYGRIVVGEELYTKMPDCDNIAKAILDALNKIAYADDKQVVSLKVEKHYDEDPRVEIELTEINNDREI